MAAVPIPSRRPMIQGLPHVSVCLHSASYARSPRRRLAGIWRASRGHIGSGSGGEGGLHWLVKKSPKAIFSCFFLGAVVRHVSHHFVCLVRRPHPVVSRCAPPRYLEEQVRTHDCGLVFVALCWSSAGYVERIYAIALVLLSGEVVE